MLDLPQRSRVLGGRLTRPLRKEQTGAADAYKRHQCRLFIYLYKSIKLFKGSITHYSLLITRPLRKEQTGAADAYKRHQCRLFICI